MREKLVAVSAENTMNDRQSLCNLRGVQRKLSQSHKGWRVTCFFPFYQVRLRSHSLMIYFHCIFMKV